ncbi:MAG: ATP-dependent helicase [Bacteroidetes bacterium]|nr:MAG: ATP-dependent helicase [Bacteroidota bacterium]MBL1144568.1 DEAD/DEAH box helicase [Bacteroidota bacterium]NOG57363.1 DEAD/DEAH box helicase [Bacteroidota bacterium]
MTFQNLAISNPLYNAMEDLGFKNPTPIQERAFPIIRSGKNVIGISQTGTGKTLAFSLPILQDLKYSTQDTPRVLILVPTRELAVQIADQIELYAKYMTVRVLKIYGGTNINSQKKAILSGCDIIVGTPGRLYDLIAHGTLKLKSVSKLVIDEVDVMLDLGFRFQLNNIFELLPSKRQNIMFSATMTKEIKALIQDFFIAPEEISIAISGTPLDNIKQYTYSVKNFYTKVNLLSHLLQDKEEFSKVLIFIDGKRNADRVFEKLEAEFGDELGIIHSNKSQNFRLNTIERFDNDKIRILLSTDIMARGLDLEKISHVICFDVPEYPENYIHRIGRTGRAEHVGKSILLCAEYETEARLMIEKLMDKSIDEIEFPEGVEISKQLTPAERPVDYVYKNQNRNTKGAESGAAFHEKKDKNKKTNQGGSYRRELAAKYKKPKTRGGKKKK